MGHNTVNRFILRQFAVFVFLFLSTIYAFPSLADPGPVFFKKFIVDVTVQPDGLSQTVSHMELQATNDSAAHGIGQQPLYFSESMQKLEILEAYTLKADGRKLPVDTKAIFPQSPPGSVQVPMFNDQKLYMLVFPDVQAGDVTVYTARLTELKPFFPGNYSFGMMVSKNISYRDLEVTIRAPKSLPLYTEARDVDFNKKSGPDGIEYKWTYSAIDALPEEAATVSPFDRLPRISASSFRNYEGVGRAYTGLAAQKVVVTPGVQAKADEITAGITDRRQQAKSIYEWVSRHIRYVAIFLDNGGMVPHDPDTVLTNGYGDCKDHTVLFASLLKAKGIASEIVLINGDNAYTLANVGLIAPLNHAMNFLPDFNLYADTTSGVATFGTLPIAEYGKPVVHALTTGRAVRTTPVLPAGGYDTTFKTVAHLDADGKVSGTTVITARGAPSIGLRDAALRIQSLGPENAVKAVLKSLNQEGSGSFEVASLDITSPEYTLSGHFQIDPDPAVLGGARFAPTLGLRVVERPGIGLMGPVNLAANQDGQATPCFSGHQLEELTLDVPPGKHVPVVPPDKDIKNDNLHYSAHWQTSGQTVTVRREFTSTIDEPLCTGRVRTATAAALRQIRDDYRTSIWLVGN
jgi:transglutaminase-like putative cysteine protease